MIKSKLDGVDEVELDMTTPEDLVGCSHSIPIVDYVKCPKCNQVVPNMTEDEYEITDVWEDDGGNTDEYGEYTGRKEFTCPNCNKTIWWDPDDFYDEQPQTIYTDDLQDISNINDIVPGYMEVYDAVYKIYEENGEDDWAKAFDIYMQQKGGNKKVKENKEVKQESKLNLQEATIKALYDGLKDNTEIDDVEGLVDDVLVVTDPEITTDEYNEVIERAEEIIEDTPEGEIPLDPTYLGEYLQICPICGGSFIEDHILEPGTACPICYETPESFVMVGKLQAEEVVADDNGLENDEEVGEEEEFTATPIEEFGAEETEDEETVEPEAEPEGELPNEEPVEREERPRGARTRRNREVASKEIPQGNILAEHKVLESKNNLYDDSITDADYKNQDWSSGRMSIDYDDDTKTNKRLYFKIDKELADTINGVHIGEITATYKPDTNTVLFFNADTGEDIDTIIYRNQTPEEIEEYMTSEAGLGLKKETVHHKSSFKIKEEDNNEDVVPDEIEADAKKELLLGAEEDDKEYTIEEVGEDKIKELADKSAFTWEGAVITDEALQEIVNDFKDKTPIKLPVHFFTWSGKLFNEIYGLTDSNAYPDDLHFLSVDLDNWSEMGNLPIFKMQVRARWLDDIVDNNAVKQSEIDSKK